MNLKIDKADYAIVYGVSEEQWPAWLLLKEETMAGVNRFWPGLAARELTEHFSRLWSEGLIECADGEDEPAIAPDYQLASEQFEFDTTVSDRPEETPLTYRLSSGGGDVWAQYAAVDWSRFFTTSCGVDPNEWTLNASVREAIEVALQPREIAPEPIPGSGRWEVLRPWQATYWKVLSVGNRFRYKYENWAGGVTLRDEDEIRQWAKLRNDFAPYWGGWHKSFEEVCREHFGET
jgi:hypothetical protein